MDGFVEKPSSKVVGAIMKGFDFCLFVFAKPRCGDVLKVIEKDAAESKEPEVLFWLSLTFGR